MKYYFVSFSHITNEMPGFGCCNYRSDRPYFNRLAFKKECEKKGNQNIIVFFYKEISEEEFKENL